MGLKLIFERKPKRPKVPVQNIVVQRLPEFYDEVYKEPVVMLPPNITPTLVENALKAAETAYYNNKKVEKSTKHDEIIEDAVIRIMQIAASDQDVISKAKEVYNYTKKKNVVFINPIEIVGELPKEE
jgi:hypothetical protein